MFRIPRPTLAPFTLMSPFSHSLELVVRDVSVFSSVVLPEPLQHMRVIFFKPQGYQYMLNSTKHDIYPAQNFQRPYVVILISISLINDLL